MWLRQDVELRHVHALTACLKLPGADSPSHRPQLNKFLAYGALVGGPQSDDSFEDSRGWCCAAYNEVAIDYNAGFTGAIARLVDYYKDQKLFSDCGLDLGWDHPNATLVRACRLSLSLLLCRLVLAAKRARSRLGGCHKALTADAALPPPQANKPKYPDNDCYHTCCRPRRSRKSEGGFHGRSRQMHHRNRKTEAVQHARRLFGIEP